MPEEGTPLTPHSHLLSADEVHILTRLFCTQGVNKVRLTGGEPLVRKDLVEVVSKLLLIQHLTTIISFHLYKDQLLQFPGWSQSL